jgi:hypothetical protein
MPGKQKKPQKLRACGAKAFVAFIQGNEGMTIRGSFPDFPRLYDMESALSTIVTSPGGKPI